MPKSHKNENDATRASDDESGATPPARPPVFSMTNEEADFDAFRDYLAGLPPDDLWDVRARLDAERYPRRHEATQREMTRRGLFYVSPYTRREVNLRTASLWGAGVPVFVALLRAVIITDARLQALGRFRIALAPGEKAPFFVGLATGGADVARTLLPILLPVAALACVAAVCVAVYAVRELRHTRIRRDVAFIAVITALLGAGLLWWAK